MIWVLPLEPLEERYTKQWYFWFKEEFEKKNIPFTYVDGEMLTTTVECGTVLDAEGTNYWKASQMLKVIKAFKNKEVKNGDVFFTMDMWHPALEMIPYMATLEKIKVDIYAFLHAGSYTFMDFAEPMAPWARYFEQGWAKMCTGIFVGSHYHKNKFIAKRVDSSYSSKIHVVGNPMRLGQIGVLTPPEKREKVIIFTHRFDLEKGVLQFISLMENLWADRQDFKVVITTSRPVFSSNSPEALEALENAKFRYEVKAGLTKDEYYAELEKAKIFVSTTEEENFGYCLTEAIARGVIPVVAEDFSHPELVEDCDFMFLDEEEALQLLNYYLDYSGEEKLVLPSVSKFENSISLMLEIMENKNAK
jgi:glycosyltransferase involved in cell wall biosynthesis